MLELTTIPTKPPKPPTWESMASNPSASGGA